MEQDIPSELLSIFRSEKYIKSLEDVISGKAISVSIDIIDLPEIVIDVLVNNYTNNPYNSVIKEVAERAIRFVEANQKSEELIETPEELLRATYKLGLSNYNIAIEYRSAPSRGIRNINSDDIGRLFKINGCIMNLTQPKSIIKKAVFKCPQCGEQMSVEQTSAQLIQPMICSCGKNRGFILVEHECIWDDYQELTIQENPDETVIGVIPRTMKITVTGEHLVDLVQPGSVIDLVCTMGVEQRKVKGEQRIFEWVLRAISIDVLTKDSFNVELSEEDIAMCREWSKEAKIRDIIVESVFPSIYGYYDEKFGLILCLFGGVENKKPDVTIKGQSNCLLLGDPGIAKTALIQAASKVAPKAMYTQAGGSSGVGLTAAVIKDGDKWILSAGAVVLTNGGVCAVDELEKMSKEDQTKLLECMEVQTVTINKASIHATLNAKTAILAAGNPKFGRYDPAYTVSENISLPAPLLARFDLIFIMRDIPEVEADSRIVDKILDLDSGDNDLPLMTPEQVKKYILYSKTIYPIMSRTASKLIKHYYIKIRAQTYEDESKPIPITPRQVQGLQRLTQAFARMSLKEEAGEEEANLAITLFDSVLKRVTFNPRTLEYDSNLFESGKDSTKYRREKMVLGFIPIDSIGITREELLIKLNGAVDDEEIDRILKGLINASGSSIMESMGKYRRVTG